MVFGSISKLQDQVFCLTEERDYFQGKFLEQVSEIAALKDQLGRSRKEIDRLRMELMARGLEDNDEDGSDRNEDNNLNISSVALPSPSASSSPRHHVQTPTSEKKMKKMHKPDEEINDDTSELTNEDDCGSNEEDEEVERGQEKDDEDKEADEIRQSAEKLLQWASYRSLTRTSASTPEHLSVSSPLSASSLQHRLGDGIPSSVQLDAAILPSSKNNNVREEEEDDDDQTFSSTASSNSGAFSAGERDAKTSPIRPGRKILQKFEDLVTSL